MSISVILNVAAVFVFGILSVTLFFAAIRIIFSDTAEYRKNRSRSPSMSAVFKGDIVRSHDGKRDSVIQAGIAVNSDNEWIEQGRLSEDSVQNILRN